MTVVEIITIFLSSLAIVVSLINFFYQLHKDKKTNKRQVSVETKQTALEDRTQRLEADTLFEKVRDKYDNLTKSLQLLILNRSFENILEVYGEYTKLFNEIEAYCCRLADNTITESDYIKKEVLPFFKKMGSKQPDIYHTLNAIARENKLPNMNVPDYGSLKSFDKILKKYCTEPEYNRIKEKRKEAKLHIFSSAHQ